METINILIRTSNRPLYFYECIRSIETQTYRDVNIIVGNDSNDSYCQHYNPIRYDALKSDRSYLKMGKENKVMHFPINLYVNYLMKEAKSGWVLILDDDDQLARPDALEIIMKQCTKTTRAIFWRVDIGGVLIPRVIRKRPVHRDISTIGFCFHSNYIPLLQWDSYKQCDFRIADRIHSILDVVWIDEVLTKTQGKGDGFGRRLDKF